MKKIILKTIVYALTFVLSLMVFSRIMNKDHNSLTVEMAAANYPIVTMSRNGVAYNELHGYAQPCDVSAQRDTVSVLGEGRKVDFNVDTYGVKIAKINLEVRSIDGSRLIENTEVSGYTTAKDMIYVRTNLKDLIDKDKEYELGIVLTTAAGKEIRYYTRIIYTDSSLNVDEKLAYVVDFHKKLFSPDTASELTKYLETNSKLESNSSFHYSNIHSSLRQLTWDELNVKQEGEAVVLLRDIEKQTASFLVKYRVSTENEKGDATYYDCEEYYRIRYTSDRIYLLDFERYVDQIPDVTSIYANDKILLGIADENVNMKESSDGKVLAWAQGGSLYSYSVKDNRMAVLFSFYDDDNNDARTRYDQHDIKILSVGDDASVTFAVYGYMNRGRYEGCVGIQVYTYDASLITLEEDVYIPYRGTYSQLAPQMDTLLYLNDNRILYLELDSVIYRVDLEDRNYSNLVDIDQDGRLMISDNNEIIVWQVGDTLYDSDSLRIINLKTEEESNIRALEGEAVMPLAFMGEDIIYGIARNEDVEISNSGSVFFPMCKLCICDSSGKVLMVYSQENIYVTGCSIQDNQITLKRVTRKDNGTYVDTTDDQIMDSETKASGVNEVSVAVIDKYERYVQIKLKSAIDPKTFKILTPKEVLYEGGRNVDIEGDNEIRLYYVYNAYGVSGIYTDPSNAVVEAYASSGVVVDVDGNKIWYKGNRSTKNQIMAIEATPVTETKDSLVICLDTILKHAGVIRNSEYLLGQGMNVSEIIEENIIGSHVLDLTGSPLDAVLYYVNKDIPVLAILDDEDEAVLITGFNEYNVVIMEPKTGKLYKKGINDSKAWFEENGNHFITYIPAD